MKGMVLHMKKFLSNTWPILTLICVALIAGGVTLVYFQGNSLPTSASQVQPVPTDADHENYNIVTVEVKSDGFYPRNIEVEAGVPTKINFKKTTSSTCITDVTSPDMSMLLYLEGKDNYFTVEDLQPGTYNYNCGMYMCFGTITVI